MQFIIFLSKGLRLSGLQDYHTCWLLRLGSSPQFHPTSHVDVRNAFLLAKQWYMADNVDGVNICSQDADAGDSLPDGLNDFLDAPLYLFFLVD